MRVIGIDPGTAIVGYGIIDYDKNKYSVVDYGVILTSKDLSTEERLEVIYNNMDKILKKYKPEFMAIEDLFYFKNNKTVISVAQARGVILLVGKQNNIPMSNYTPLQVKIGITGYGKAEKKQVQQMVQKFLGLSEIPKPDDAADALAICITHINSLGSKLNFTGTNILKKMVVPSGTNKISLEDGFALVNWIKLGGEVVILTGKKSNIVERRAKELGIKYVIQGSKNKTQDLKNLLNKLNITFENTAYMGDDLNDLGVMKNVALSGCPKDSVQEVLEISNFISTKNGGDGAVREFLEYIMKNNGMWKKILEKYSSE